MSESIGEQHSGGDKEAMLRKELASLKTATDSNGMLFSEIVEGVSLRLIAQGGFAAVSDFRVNENDADGVYPAREVR